MRFWQKRIRGWTVPFWFSDIPLVSKRVSEMSIAAKRKLINKLRSEK